jgi:hypothetical protein
MGLYVSLNLRNPCFQVSTKEQEEQLRKMQDKYGVDGEQHPKGQSAE